MTNLLLAYISLHLAVLWHEIGHFGRMKYLYSPFIPIMYVENPKSIIGGIIFNLIGLYTIFKLNPSNLLLLFFGLFSWLHFLSYTLIEPIYPLREKYGNVSDIRQINKKYWMLFFIVGILVLLFFKNFYIPIFIDIY